MKRTVFALIALFMILSLVFAAVCVIAWQRTVRSAEAIIAGVIENDPESLESCLAALLGARPEKGAASKGEAAAVDRWNTLFPYELFANRIWSPELKFTAGITVSLCALGSAAFLLIERKRRVRYKVSLTERVNAALRGEAAFAPENDEERIMAHLLAEIDRLNTVREDSAEELRMYVENVAHELKTHASGLILSLDLMEKNGVTGEKLSVARGCAMRIGSYVTSLLTLARVRAGKVRFTFEPFDTGELVNEIAEDLRANGVLVSVVGRGATINGDRTRVREAVQNLIVNAAKHKRTGEPVIVRLESTGLDTAIRIGVGVGGSAKSAVIERYAVGEEDGTSSGIGLSLAQAVAGRHSGKLNVRWDDEGSEAELIIPVFKLKKSV